jgi:hypothetical protein
MQETPKDDRADQGSQIEHFGIHASVVFQLGESLITDSVQALVELVKNSYDADASYCKITISTEQISDPGARFKGAVGSITVEDDGTGMSLSDIRRGWLTISNSGKKDFKDRLQTTKKGRTPLGDKGLGRLGTQRLGDNVEIVTRAAESALEHDVWFSWKDFRGQRNLPDIDIGREDRPPTREHGTTLIVSGLREPDLWKGDGVKELGTSLSQLISPYRAARDFVVYAVVDGTELELIEIGEKLRQAAQVHYDLKFDGDTFRISGKARFVYIRPERNPQDKALFYDLVEKDGGQRFFNFLQQRKGAKDFQFEKLTGGGWFVGFKKIRHLDEIDRIALVDRKPANPGPFYGEIDFFSLGSTTDAEETVFSNIAEFRLLIGQLRGIKVFRDGFGIRVAPDWLGLGKQWTKGGSYYGLKPENTLGYIAISARDNRQLEETTDREGFKVNPFYNNFYELLSSFVQFSGDAQEFLRRGWIDFRKSVQRTNADVAQDTKPEELSIKIKRGLARAAKYRQALSQAYMRLRTASDASRGLLAGIDHLRIGNGEFKLFETAFGELTAALGQAELVVRDVEAYLDEVGRLESVEDVLGSQIETLRHQIQDVHEIIGLGLTAEALSHETSNITTQLAQRTQQLVRYLRTNSIRDRRIVSFTEYVKTSIAGLQRQMLFLAPSLRYVREKREIIDVEQFVDEISKHYTMHIGSLIGIIPRFRKGQNFKIEINKGKLIQILDNLILNSEYWIKEDIRTGHLAQGRITRGLTNYYDKIKQAFRSVSAICNSKTTIIQMLAFSEPAWQLPKYLEMLEEAGLTEITFREWSNNSDGRIWRDVPNRKWYATHKGLTPGSKEVVLFHRLAC